MTRITAPFHNLAIFAALFILIGCDSSDEQPDTGPSEHELDTATPIEDTQQDSADTPQDSTDTPQDSTDTPPSDIEPVDIRILAINDVHGYLAGPTGRVIQNGNEIVVGGADYVAAHVEYLAAEVEHSTFVHSGDLVGGSPSESALLYEESTIQIFNEMGLDIAGIGNHEFGRGVREFLRLNQPDPAASAIDQDHQFEGAQFDYLAANAIWRSTDEPIMAPYTIREYDSVKVGYIGVTLRSTPNHVPPRAVEDIYFQHEVEAVKRYLPELRAQGADTIVVLLHQGGRPQGESNDIGDCDDLQGPIVEITEQLPDEIEIVLSAHTHSSYICEFDNTLITQAAVAGRVITSIDLRIDPLRSEIVERHATQHPVSHDIEPNHQITNLIDEFSEIAANRSTDVLATITDDIPSSDPDEIGSSPIARLIADAQWNATADDASADFAFVDPGSIGDDLSYSQDDLAAGAVTFEHLHATQRFHDTLITMTLTGTQILEVLEQQWRTEGEARSHSLIASSELSYKWIPNADIGSHIDQDSVTVGTASLDPHRDYRVTVTDYLADGGNGFTVFAQGSARTTGVRDLQALLEYFESNSPVEPPENNRGRPADL